MYWLNYIFGKKKDATRRRASSASTIRSEDGDDEVGNNTALTNEAAYNTARGRAPNRSSTIRPSSGFSEEHRTTNDFFIFPASGIDDSDSSLRASTKIPAYFLKMLTNFADSKVSGAATSTRSDIELNLVSNEDSTIGASSARTYVPNSKRYPPFPLDILLKNNSFAGILAFIAKDGGNKTKINGTEGPESIVAGNMPLSSRFVSKRNIATCATKEKKFTRGYSLFDTVNPSTFFDGCVNAGASMTDELKNKFFATDGVEIKEVKVLGGINGRGGLICFSEMAPIFAKNKQDPTPKPTSLDKKEVHYIQRSESLHSILKNIARGIYLDPKIISGQLSFRHKDVEYSGFSLNIIDILPAIENVSLFESELQKTIIEILDFKESKSKQKDVLSIENQAGYAQLFYKILEEDYHCPIWETTKEGIKIPLMVRAGSNGLAIAGDIDMLHIPAPFDLPAGVHETHMSSNVAAANLFESLESAADWAKQIKSTSQYTTQSGLAKIFTDNIQDAIEYYRRLEKQEPNKLKILGTTSVYNMVMQYYLNVTLNGEVNGEMPRFTDLICHAPETSNPTAEEFGSTLTAWKDTYFYAANESAYLHFLLHDREILRQYPLCVNAYWLRDLEKDDTCSQIWRDIIEIQALNCLLQGQPLDNYFGYILNNLCCPNGLEPAADKLAEYRTIAIGFVEKLQKELNKGYKDAEETRQNIKDRVDSLYKRHERGCTPIQEAMGRSLEKENKHGVANV